MYFRPVDITSHEDRSEMFLVDQAEKLRKVDNITFLGALMLRLKYLISLLVRLVRFVRFVKVVS